MSYQKIEIVAIQQMLSRTWVKQDIDVVPMNRPAMNEVFTNGRDATLVDPNGISKLTESIVRVLQDRHLRDLIGINGRKLIESKYSKEIRRQKPKEHLNIQPKKENPFKPIWLIVYLICCLIIPAIIFIQALVDGGFRKSWLSVMIGAGFSKTGTTE